MFVGINLFKQRPNVNQKIVEIFILAFISIILGLGWYLILYGRYSLYFSNVNWIYNTGRDLLKHQLGWEFFRQEPWRFPLGTIKNYGYPIGTTVSFMDSIPLLAIFFKLLSPWLSASFQYVGIWELSSVIGQIFITMMIVREFSRSYIKQILSGSLLVLASPFLFRSFFHCSLTAHWIILLAILFIIYEFKQKLGRWAWPLLFLTSMFIHLYFIPMLFVLWGISTFIRLRKISKKYLIIFDLLCIVTVVFGSCYLLGLFNLQMSDLSEIHPGDLFSWNLNQFVNSMGYSNIIKGLPLFNESQMEGFSYFGLGYLLIILVSLVVFFLKETSKGSSKEYRYLWFPFGIASLFFILISLKNHAYIGDQTLWNIRLPFYFDSLINLFRSTGRFIWPVFYFMIIFSLIVLVRNIKYFNLLLIIALFLQFFDLQPLIAPKKQTEFVPYYGGGLSNNIWQPIGETNEHIEIIPTEYYEQLALFAVHHHMTINTGYFSRADYQGMENIALQTWENMIAGDVSDNTIYILSEDKYLDKAREYLSANMYVCFFNGFTVLFSKNNLFTKKDFQFKEYCIIPFD